AFSIPVIQIVYETLKDHQEGKKGKATVTTGGAAIGADGLCCQSREVKEWHGCRSTKGVSKGTDKFGFGFGGTGKKSHNKQFDSYGENAELKFNFGGEDFKHPPKDGYVALDKAADAHVVKSKQTGSAQVSQAKNLPNAPKALIIEPSRELAEQTLNNVKQFKKYVDNPKIRELLIIGGVAAKEQLAVLESGVDIVVGTPGRIDDLISTGKISLSQVRFLVLDEADGLLTAGYTDFITRVHNQIPQITSDGKRLQVIVCSATLHSFDVKKLSEKIMHFPTWVDLKGEDSVPETVHHVVVPVNPKTDRLWERLGKNHIRTDEVHAKDHTRPGANTPEMFSEAIKILKGEYTVRAIKEHKMDQAIIFCRTKIDCDNMEQYFIQQGGVINVTLPDEKQNYVWYHVCPNRGRGCYNTRLKDEGGCTIWYNENQLLAEIEDHLNCTVSQVETDIKVPLDEFDGKVTYGQRRATGGGLYKGHVDVLAPTVQELAALEKEAQTSFLHLGYLPNQLFRTF
ncbi:DDX1 helicase, partial [Polypterus senegalus]